MVSTTVSILEATADYASPLATARYTCPGDGPPLYPGHHGWHKWCDSCDLLGTDHYYESDQTAARRFEHPLTERGHPRFDLYPECAVEEGFNVPGLTLPGPSGGPAKLFSSRNPTTVKRHFRLMAEHGIDGIFLMRMANECEVDPRGPMADLMRISDGVLDLVRSSAEAESRVWALMFVQLSESLGYVLTI